MFNLIYMRVDRKIFILCIILIFVSSCSVYFAYDNQNIDGVNAILNLDNKTDEIGCCSVLWQLDGNNTILSYRRDANLTADINIQNVTWHGIPALKQSKTEGGEFTHVVITNNGWIISMGGIDDGEGNQKCDEIASHMINDNNSISKDYLTQIQEIKKEYKRGHFLIKAPNGNYGYTTDEVMETGKLEPGQYLSLPNKYSFFRSGEISPSTDDKIKAAIELALSDEYGINRREIITYVNQANETNIHTDIYASNDDGSYFGVDYKDCVDNVIFYNDETQGSDLPIAPDYKELGTVTFKNIDDGGNSSKLNFIIILVAFVIIVAILFFIMLKLVRFIRYR